MEGPKMLKYLTLIATLYACSSTGGKRITLMAPPAPAEQRGECRKDGGGKGRYMKGVTAAIFGTEENAFRGGDRYTFTFTDTSLREALLELSSASGVPIVFDEAINGSASIEVKSKSFIDALQMLLSSGPYDFKYDGRYFFVGIADGRGDDWQRLAYHHSYRTNNITPSVAVKLLNPVFKNYVTADDTLGVISIMAPRKQMLAIISSLYDLDTAPRQVLLKMNIAEITDDAVRQLGRNTSGGTLFGAVNAFSPLQPAFRSAVLNQETYSNFLSSVDFLARTGKADIRAQPKIIVLDGVKAKFESRTSRFFRNDRFFGGGVNGNFNGGFNGMNGNGSQTGVSMAIVPYIVSGNEVLLDIQDATSGDVDVADDSKINENSISTKVRVKEGDTLLIGGMISKKKRLVTSKVPWLGDIPYLGWLFKTQRHEEASVEVIFSVSPEIICPSNRAG